MRPVLPIDLHVDQFEVGLVYDRGGLKRVSGAFLPHIFLGDPVQSVVNARHDVV